MSHKLKSVREKLDAISSEKHKFHLREEIILRDREAGVLDWRQTTSLVNESEIIGREKEKQELMSMLLANSEHLSIYAICGMVGLGKTTLAQLLYNDRTIQSYFDLRIWVCVSDDFDLRRLVGAIIESIEGCPPNYQELDPLQRLLREKLSRKKFLLILDDVWNEDAGKWDGLHHTIRCGSTGSAVVVTTRNENIALMMATSPICYIQRLSEDESWSLFEQRAFGLGRKEEVARLETVGRDIVIKCGGLPLAVKAMGSMMRLKRKENEWLSVRNSEIWDLLNEGSTILSALKLSYNHLAVHVKRCFALCSIFPKDYEMEKDMLIELWMANGFIPCDTQMDLYDRGQEIFEELVWRSFFQDVKERDFTGTITFKMHDLIHDLAQSVMIDECKLIKSDKVLVVPKTVRHMSIFLSSEQAFPQGNKLFRGQSLRSFLWLGPLGYPDDWHQAMSFYLSGQKNLRVLGLFSSGSEKIPISISRLRHLRYLDFSNSSIKTLSELLTSLQNLQTLNLRNCNELCKLPRGLKYMKNLIHLDIRGCHSLTYLPGEMGKLTCLRKLSDFIVGKDNGHQIGELKELNLGGDLSITKIEYVKSCSDAKSANLMQKKELSSLSLFWSGEEEYDSNIFEEVLDGLQPYSNLKKLSIDRYEGSHFPDWMMNLLLPNLVEINLVGGDRCTRLPQFGNLQFLRVLQLKGINGVKCIGNGDSSFPSLERLSLNHMGGLEVLSMQMVDGRNLFPVLESLYIYHCPKLMELPVIASPVFQSLHISHCPIHYLPEGLNYLETLDVDDCGIKSFPTINGCSGYSSLRRFWFRDCGDFSCLSDGVRHLTRLEVLLFDRLPKLNSLPNSIGHLTALQTLSIRRCEGLSSLPNELENLTSLSKLKIYDCPELESLAEGLSYLEELDATSCGIKSFPSINGCCEYSSLRRLSFINCREFACLLDGVRHLIGLEDLMLCGLPKLNSLPDSIGHLTVLRELRIWDCEELCSLPKQIENLTSLSRLEIRSCRKVMCLPDGISNLKMLSELSIRDCPILKERYQKERVDDWPKIAHIPHIRIVDY